MRKQDITYQQKLNELRLDIGHPNNKGLTFVLVEGESDIRLFRKLFNLDFCKVENVPGGKIKLEECVAQLVDAYSFIFGIRDADFLHMGANPYMKRNMFLTDFHDLEMSIIAVDEIFSALLFEHTTIPKADHASIRSNIFKSIEKISLLKWLNEIEDLEISFEAGFQDLISFQKLDIDFSRYFSRLLSKSPNAKEADPDVILNKIDRLRNMNPKQFQLCNGHDFMKAASYFINSIGSTKNVTHESITRAFRMAYKNEYFTRTDLFLNTKAWADTNSCSIFA
jgi:hypothetical protein